jgi:hypothetical protein
VQNAGDGLSFDQGSAVTAHLPADALRVLATHAAQPAPDG